MVEVWVDHPSLDYLMTAALVVGATSFRDPIGQILPATAPTWYQTLAGLGGAVLGFGVLAVTLLLGAPSTLEAKAGLNTLRPRINRLISSCLSGLLSAMLGFALLNLTDLVRHREAVGRLVIVLIAFAVLRSARLWWLIIQLIKVMTRTPVKTTGPTTGTARSVNALGPWLRPEVVPGNYQVAPRKTRS